MSNIIVFFSQAKLQFRSCSECKHLNVSFCLLEWNGGMLLAVPPENTSQTCLSCDYISKDNRRSQALFKCVSCQYENNADVVGAINVLERGHRLLTCGETVRLGRSKKQEPAEAIQLVFN